jgi:hypothetical protein
LKNVRHPKQAPQNSQGSVKTSYVFDAETNNLYRKRLVFLADNCEMLFFSSKERNATQEPKMPIRKPFKKAEPPTRPPALKKKASRVQKAEAIPEPTSEPTAEFQADDELEPPPDALFSLWGSQDEGLPELYGVGGDDVGYIVHWYVSTKRIWCRKVVMGKIPILFGVWGNSEGGLCVAVGAGVIMRTVDNGDAWERCSYQEKTTLYRVGFTDTLKKLWAVGEEGLVVCSTDKGKSWQRVSIPSSEKLISVYAIDSLVLIGDADGVFCISEDEGNSWRAVKSGVSFPINRIWGTSSQLYAVTNRGCLLSSNTKGASWKKEKLALADSDDLEGGCGNSSQLYLVGQTYNILSKTGDAAWTQIETDDYNWDAISIGKSTYISSTSGQVYQLRGQQFIEITDRMPFTE